MTSTRAQTGQWCIVTLDNLDFLREYPFNGHAGTKLGAATAAGRLSDGQLQH